ncbi:unnamed protein product [Rotaria socialis]
MIGIILLGSLVATLVLYFGYSLTAATTATATRTTASTTTSTTTTLATTTTTATTSATTTTTTATSATTTTTTTPTTTTTSATTTSATTTSATTTSATTTTTTTTTSTTTTTTTSATTTTTTTTTYTTTTMVPLNLLVDPGAESPGLAGWTQTGSSNVLQDTGGLEFAGYNPHTGSACFAGGFGLGGSPSSLLQNVNLLNGMQNFSAAQLDTGTLHAKISFYYQSYYSWLYPYDDAEVTITFLSNTNAVLGTQDTGYQICSSNNPGWCYYNNLYSLPVGTRSIDYKMIFTRNSGTKITAYIDDNSLTLV